MDQYSEVRTTTMPPTGSTRAPGVAPEQTEVGELMDEAMQTASQTAGQMGGMLQKQMDNGLHMAGQRLHGAVSNLNQVADTLEQKGNKGTSELIHNATDRVESMTHYLETADSQQLLSDAGRYARGHVWTVMIGGAVLGIVASRFLKAALSAPASHPTRSPSSYQTM